MKRIIALSVLFLIPAAAFAQNFDTEKYKSAIERKAYTAAQDNTRVVSNVKSIDLENYNERQKMFEAAGTDLTKYETAARHANIHLNVIKGNV